MFADDLHAQFLARIVPRHYRPRDFLRDSLRRTMEFVCLNRVTFSENCLWLENCFDNKPLSDRRCLLQRWRARKDSSLRPSESKSDVRKPQIVFTDLQRGGRPVLSFLPILSSPKIKNISLYQNSDLR